MKPIFNKPALLALVLLYSVFMLAGCFNPLTAPDGQGNGAKRGVTVTVKGDGVGGSRTLTPDVEFTRYRLSFSSEQGFSHDDVHLTKENPSELIENLESGYWTITAYGYVRIAGDDYEAAEGSARVEVLEDTPTTTVSISLGAKQSGDAGYFTYSVVFPSEKVNSAVLRIYPFGGYEWGDDTQTFDLTIDNSGRIPLPPGYYQMTIQLQNAYQTAGHSEIVHIYPELETCTPYYEFLASDFTDTLTLRGTADVTINDSRPQDVEIYARDTTTGNEVGYTYPDSDGRWSMTIPRFDQPTGVAFDVVVYDDDDNFVYKKTIPGVYTDDISDIDLGVDITTITLNGTAFLTVDGMSETDLYVYVDMGGGGIGNSARVESNGLWSMTVAFFEQPTTASFFIEYGDGRINTLETREVLTGPISDIDLNITTRKLSGEIVNGSMLEEYMVAALREEIESLDDPDIMSKLIGQCIIVNREWELHIPNTALSELWFVVWDGGSNYYITTTAKSTAPPISLDISEMRLLTEN